MEDDLYISLRGRGRLDVFRWGTVWRSNPSDCQQGGCVRLAPLGLLKADKIQWWEALLKGFICLGSSAVLEQLCLLLENFVSSSSLPEQLHLLLENFVFS
jgi:hypothetical protein